MTRSLEQLHPALDHIDAALIVAYRAEPHGGIDSARDTGALTDLHPHLDGHQQETNCPRLHPTHRLTNGRSSLHRETKYLLHAEEP